MRGLFLFAYHLFASAQATTSQEKAECLVEGGEAVDDLLDASIFLWAASKRCGRPGEGVKCEIDVTSAIGAINGMLNTILGAANRCGALHTANRGCGLSAGAMTKSLALLGAATGEIVQKCPKSSAIATHSANWNQSGLATCIVDIKGSAKSLFNAIESLTTVSGNCVKPGLRESFGCQTNGFKIMGALSGVGEYLAGAVGHCSKNVANPRGFNCASAVTALLHQLANLGKSLAEMAVVCRPTGKLVHLVSPQEASSLPRLYERETRKDSVDKFQGHGRVGLALALPLVAVVGFFSGKFHVAEGICRQQHRECTPMILREFSSVLAD